MGGAKRQIGRQRRGTVLERIGEGLEKQLPTPLEPLTHHELTPARGRPGPESQIERAGLLDALCRLRYVGHSNAQIAKMLRVSSDSVDRMTRSDYFARYYEQQKVILLAQTGEMLASRVCEVVLEALEWKITTLRSQDKRIRAHLKNAIASELIELGRELMQGKATGASDAAFKAIYQKAVTKRAADGSRTTETYRIEGPPLASAPAGWPDESAGGGEPTLSDGRAGAEGRAEGAAALEGEVGSGGADAEPVEGGSGEAETAPGGAPEPPDRGDEAGE